MFNSSSSIARNRERSFGTDEQWFVYLLPLQDCTAFKVGMTCNPLQRMSTFSVRYFERFDLAQGRLLQVKNRLAARTVESEIKKLMAPYAIDCPEWVPAEAGGYTEWFAAPYWSIAEAHLQSGLHEATCEQIVGDHVRLQLVLLRDSFEHWAMDNAKRVCDSAYSTSLGYETNTSSRTLRTWLDAYRHFAVPIFADDPAALEFVRKSAQLFL